MRELSLRELKGMIDHIIEQYPLARVSVVYPKMRGGKRASALGNFTTYSVHLDTSNDQRATVHFYVDWSREPDAA